MVDGGWRLAILAAAVFQTARQIVATSSYLEANGSTIFRRPCPGFVSSRDFTSPNEVRLFTSRFTAVRSLFSLKASSETAAGFFRTATSWVALHTVDVARGRRQARRPHAPLRQQRSQLECAAVDPETGILYVPSVTDPWVFSMAKSTPDRSDMAYIGRGGRPDRPLGMPLVRPPWGRITAIDMNTGEQAWMKPNGPAPEAFTNPPAAKGLDLSEAGNPAIAMLLVTKTLLFTGEGAGLVNGVPGGGDPTFRVFDKTTGKILHEMKMPGLTSAPPMTYFLGGKQHIVLATTNRTEGAELVALTLRDGN